MIEWKDDNDIYGRMLVLTNNPLFNNSPNEAFLCLFKYFVTNCLIRGSIPPVCFKVGVLLIFLEK